ncbi:MAG: RNA polymerase sigma factor, partial [Opitutales bacterium]
VRPTIGEMSTADTETLRSLYVGSRQHLYTYAVSITGQRESAEDAIQAVFERLLRRGELPADLRPYVFRCVRNAALDALRRTRVRTDSIFHLAADGSEPPPVFAAGELERWLQVLSPDERETIVLKIYNEFTFQQIADLRQVPLPTVASWYRRGLDKLKANLTTGTL